MIHYTPVHLLTRFFHESLGFITRADRLAVATGERKAAITWIAAGVSEESLMTFMIYDMLSLSVSVCVCLSVCPLPASKLFLLLRLAVYMKTCIPHVACSCPHIHSGMQSAALEYRSIHTQANIL